MRYYVRTARQCLVALISMIGVAFPGENGGSDEAVVVGGGAGTRIGRVGAAMEPGTKVHAGDPSRRLCRG
eukprot:SAG25_NODE_294_length_10260_cov_64.173211_8_plen_70_part_00